MEKLINTIRSNFEDLNDMLSSGDAAQFEAYEAESFCKSLGEIIVLMEKNPTEMVQLFGEGTEIDLNRLKSCAVAVYKSIPHLERADEYLSENNDEIHDVIGIYLDHLESLD